MASSLGCSEVIGLSPEVPTARLSFQPALHTPGGIAPSSAGGFAQLVLSTSCMHWAVLPGHLCPCLNQWQLPPDVFTSHHPTVPLCRISQRLVISCHFGQIQEPAFLAQVYLWSELHLCAR